MGNLRICMNIKYGYKKNTKGIRKPKWNEETIFVRDLIANPTPTGCNDIHSFKFILIQNAASNFLRDMPHIPV